jgi:D-3-phosphoglycerate dehydrogenase
MDVPRVVIADPLAPAGVNLLQKHLDVVVATDPDELPDALVTAHGLVVRSRTTVNADLLRHTRSLRLVARAGIGIDNIDVPAATDRGVLVINAPQGNVRSTAEHTVALIFALARRVVAADAAVRSGLWKSGYEGMQLEGKRLGVIGLGKIGRQVAAIARAIGMEVVGHDPYLPTDAFLDVPLISMDDLLSTADIVTIHVPLTVETHRFFGADHLARMKAGSYLVNAARGGLVDEAAAVRALQDRHLAGAAFDVFEEEPLGASPLLSAPNVVLTPHVAASTREAQLQVSTEVATQVLEFFAGRPVAYPINPTVLEGQNQA